MEKAPNELFVKRTRMGLIIGSIILTLGIVSLIWGSKDKSWIGIFMVIYGLVRVSMSAYFMNKMKKNNIEPVE